MGSVLGGEHTCAPTAMGMVPSAFPSGMEIKVPVLAQLLCLDLVPEPLLMHGEGLGWLWRGAVSHVGVCMGGSTTYPPPLYFQGFKYLYLTPQDYTRISAMNSVHCEHVEDGGESR